MSIHINEHTKNLIQGFTGKIGTFHAQEMIQYGANVVGAVAPGKGGSTHLGLPVYNSMKDAVKHTGATASIIFIPPPFAADSIMQAADAGISFCVNITDGIPTLDMITVKRYMRRYKKDQRMVLTGPNFAGTISPGKSMMGIMLGHIYLPGNVGIIGRFGTLGYEAASQMKSLGIGVFASVGIGGDVVNGGSFKDHLKFFEQDPNTHAVIIIGETGGSKEVKAALWTKDNMTKPLVGYIAGLTAPKGKRMGHAGAIINTVDESVVEKVAALKACGVTVVPHPPAFGTTMQEVLNNMPPLTP